MENRAGAGIPVARSHDALLAHERAPAEADLLVDIHLAQPDDIATGPHTLHREAERGLVSRGLEDIIGAAPRGERPHLLRRVGRGSIDHIGRTESRRARTAFLAQ